MNGIGVNNVAGFGIDHLYRGLTGIAVPEEDLTCPILVLVRSEAFSASTYNFDPAAILLRVSAATAEPASKAAAIIAAASLERVMGSSPE